MVCLSVLASLALSSAASAGCIGSTCSLGGQLRAQVGFDLPLPISFNPAGTGDLRWGQPGLIQATPSATIQQGPAGAGTPGTDPRSLRIVKPGVFTYDGPLISFPVFNGSHLKTFAIQTNLDYESPHPGTSGSGGPAAFGPFATQTLEAGGRTGPAIVTWCAGLPAPTASYNPGCSAPDHFGFATNTTNGGTNVTRPVTNGLVRYSAIKNQFGGPGRARALGSAMVFFNAAGLGTADLPCTIGTNALCLVFLAVDHPPTQAVIGGRFAHKLSYPPLATTASLREANIGPSGTIRSLGVGQPIYTSGRATTSWGLPGTTGMLTISVTQNADAPTRLETFTRTGGDNRTPGGEGIVVLVGGGLSSRSISGPNGNRSWATYNVPEPNVILATSAGLLVLLACHQLAQRRRR
jgi:hypothetical protein